MLAKLFPKKRKTLPENFRATFQIVARFPFFIIRPVESRFWDAVPFRTVWTYDEKTWPFAFKKGTSPRTLANIYACAEFCVKSSLPFFFGPMQIWERPKIRPDLHLMVEAIVGISGSKSFVKYFTHTRRHKKWKQKPPERNLILCNPLLALEWACG